MFIVIVSGFIFSVSSQRILSKSSLLKSFKRVSNCESLSGSKSALSRFISISSDSFGIIECEEDFTLYVNPVASLLRLSERVSAIDLLIFEAVYPL